MINGTLGLLMVGVSISTVQTRIKGMSFTANIPGAVDILHQHQLAIIRDNAFAVVGVVTQVNFPDIVRLQKERVV